MIALDVHTHLIPIQPERLARLDGVCWKAREGTLVLDGRPIGFKRLFDPDQLLAWMDARNIQRALVSVPPPAWRQTLAQPQAMQWVQYLNEELLAVTRHYHPRLGTLYYLPLEHPDALDALVQGYSTRYDGVALAAGGHPGIVYSHAHYEPLWRWLDSKQWFVFIHPGTCDDPRLAPFYLENLIGNPYETGVAATHLVMAGIPARYPNIRFCLAHAGGIFPALCGRLEHGFQTHRPGIDLSVERPRQAARRFQVDCIAHHPASLQLARDVLGQDKILFGSDYPFPMGIDDPGTASGETPQD